MLRVFIFAFVLLLPVLARAADSDALYTVSDLELDVTAETSTAAREEALLKGQRRALERVMKRLTVEYDWEYLPRPSDEEVLEVVQDLAVLSEKRSSVRYIATVRVRLKPEAVKTLLREADIPFTESASPPVLAMPLYRTPQKRKPLLWDENNPWMTAWKSEPGEAGLVPVVVPLGDLQDMDTVSADDAAHVRVVPLKTLATRYDVDNVAVFEAIPLNTEPKRYRVVVRPVRGTFDPRDERIDVTAGEDESEAELLLRAAKKALGVLEERWKKKEVIQFSEAAELVVLIPLTSLSSWVEMQKRLEDIELVSDYELQAMKKNKAQIRLRFSGSTGRLISALAKEGLWLEKKNGIWHLRREKSDES